MRRGGLKPLEHCQLILELLTSKDINEKQQDVTRVYLELWSRHIDGGIIEMTEESNHAYAAGYRGSRGPGVGRANKILEQNGFIKSKENRGPAV